MGTGVYLERLWPITAPLQAFSLRKLVRNQVRVENVAKDGATKRYTTLDKAIPNAVRVARHNGHYAYVIRDRLFHAAEGIATIIPDIELILEDEGPVRAHDVDYWLRAGLPLDKHVVVAEAVVKKSAQLARRLGEPSHRYFATVRAGQPWINIGFTKLDSMRQTPALLGDVGEDFFGIDKAEPVDFYYGHDPVPKGLTLPSFGA